eukprot:5956872-Prymnesium_polylepis.1
MYASRGCVVLAHAQGPMLDAFAGSSTQVAACARGASIKRAHTAMPTNHASIARRPLDAPPRATRSVRRVACRVRVGLALSDEFRTLCKSHSRRFGYK